MCTAPRKPLRNNWRPAGIDEATGDLLAFVEGKHPPATLHILRNQDDGITWSPQTFSVLPNSQGHLPAMHMNEHASIPTALLAEPTFLLRVAASE
jgi:hypothetical protein